MRSFDFPKRIAFITAHPDDETEIAAGSIFINSQSGGESYLFCATKGEKGKAYLNKEIEERVLGSMRERELRLAGEYLGIKKIIVSDFKDGAVAQELERLVTEVRMFLEEVRPEVVVSFGEDGYSGHRDHIALFKVVERLSKEFNFAFLKFAGPRKEDCPEFDQCLLAKRKNGSYQDLQYLEGNIKVKIDQKVKLFAMGIYETQLAGLDPRKIFPESVATHLLEYEYFYDGENEDPI